MTSESGVGVFHHVGLAVRDIDRSAEALATVFGAVADSDVIHDPIQGVRVKFMKMGDLRIELIEPASDDNPLQAILRRGIGVYHVCHEVADLDATLLGMTDRGAKLIASPQPAAAFEGRRIAFVMAEGLMVELLEARQP